MSIWWLALILGSIGSIGVGFIWVIVAISKISGSGSSKDNPNLSLEQRAQNGAEDIFNDDFREELKNRGRLNFEKIISENAMFLQQDLRLTTTELNDYLKSEISTSLKGEFEKYEQSISDAKELAVEAIQKTSTEIDNQRQMLQQQVQKEVDDAKKTLIDHFDNNMANIVNHYILAAVGDQIDLNDQLEYILADLESNKQAILEDIKNGT
jgi:hypothetical protein